MLKLCRIYKAIALIKVVFKDLYVIIEINFHVMGLDKPCLGTV